MFQLLYNDLEIYTTLIYDEKYMAESYKKKPQRSIYMTPSISPKL